MVTLFNYLRKCWTVFQSGCTILHSLKQCYQGSNFPHLLQHVLLPVFVITTLLEGDEVVSPCIFLKANINKAFLDHSILFIFFNYYHLYYFFIFDRTGSWLLCAGFSLIVVSGAAL